MSIRIVTRPQGSVIQASAVRDRLGLVADVSDQSISDLVDAATEALDGPDGWLGRAVRRWDLEMRIDHFPVAGGITLRFPPISQVTSIGYLDGGGAVQTLDASAWQFDGDRTIYPAFRRSWPASHFGVDAVRIRYLCGYEDGAVPKTILQAILLAVASLGSLQRSDPALSSETVPGVLSRSWSKADIGEIYDNTATRLLGPLRVFE